MGCAVPAVSAWGWHPAGLPALQGSQGAQGESWGKRLLIHYSIAFLQQYTFGLRNLKADRGGLNPCVCVVALWAWSSSEDTNSLLEPGSRSAPASGLLTDLRFSRNKQNLMWPITSEIIRSFLVFLPARVAILLLFLVLIIIWESLQCSWCSDHCPFQGCCAKPQTSFVESNTQWDT